MINSSWPELSPCIICVQYRGGVQYHGGYHEYRGGYLEYCGVFSTVGDIMSTMEGVQYRGGKSFVI